MRTLVIATRNQHKVGEIQAVLGTESRYLTLRELSDAPEIVEDGATFADNARKKALSLAQWLAAQPAQLTEGRLWVLADDSGLEVDALDGAPGVHSARFAAEETGATGNAPDAANNARLLHLLRDVPPERRTARFRCAIAVASAGEGAPDPAAVRLFEGACEGRILDAPRGGAGFGYDPLFQPDGYDQTFAELGAEVKNRISHRARALAQMAVWWREVGAG
jgi:XTP/dITP diphosphohydrolase